MTSRNLNRNIQFKNHLMLNLYLLILLYVGAQMSVYAVTQHHFPF